MSEYIIEIPDECFASYDAERDVYYPDERDSAMRITPIVRCRDCKYGIDGGEYCAEDCTDSWDWRCVEPDGFCAWAERRDNFTTCKCGEDIETNGRESVTCPSCGRVITE